MRSGRSRCTAARLVPARLLPALPLVLLLSRLLLAAPSAIALDATPLWTGEGNQSNAQYGWAVGTAGDVNGDGYSDVIVGARRYDAGSGDEGRAWVYFGGPDGPAATAAWTAESDQVFAFFATTVAPAGDVNGDGYHDVIVGAPQQDGLFVDEGFVGVWLGGPSGLAGDPVWTRGSGQGSAILGSAAAGAGDVDGDGYDDVIVGARGWDGAEDSTGKVWLYRGGAEGPDSTAAWTFEGTQLDEAVGWSASGAGDVNADGYADVIVGAFRHDGALVDEGAAFVFLGGPGGLATTPAWTGLGGQAGASFGWSVGPAGDVDGDGYADVIVGARDHDGAFSGGGRAWIFRGGAGGITADPPATIDGDQANAWLGWSVGTAGDVDGDGLADVVIGAPGRDRVWTDAGEVRVHRGTATGGLVEAAPAWVAGGAIAGAKLGQAVGSAGDVDGDGYGDVIAGAPFDANGQTGEGRAFVWRGGGSLPAPDAAWRASGGPQGAGYGYAVAWAGDVDGDGRSDLLVGDPWSDLGGALAGRVDLFLGQAGGPGDSPAWTTVGGAAGASWGRALAPAGDVDGDGYADVLVAAPFRTVTFAGEGRVALFGGGPGGLDPAPAWEATGGAASAVLGFAVAGGGDFDGDGFADVAAGAPGAGGAAGSAVGVVRVWLGGAAGLGAEPDVVREGDETAAQFGAAVASAGDVDGDGWDDLLVGEPGATAGAFSNAGRAHLFPGGPGGPAAAAAWSATGDTDDARFGERVAAAGDVDGDGFADVLVTAPGADGGGSSRGVVFLFRGGPAGLDAAPAWSVDSGADFAGLSDARGCGAVDGDGFADILVASEAADGSASGDGVVRLYLGGPAGPETTPAATWTGGVDFARLGASLAGPGDADGDGWPDVVCGARGLADSAGTGGAALAFPGGGGAGAARLPRQRRADDSAPVALRGRGDSPTSFRLRTLGRTAAGRGRVALVHEVRVGAEPFDAAGAITALPVDTGAAVPGAGSRVELEAIAGGLVASRTARWRVRVVSDDPRFPGSPWFGPAGAGPGEAALRALPPAVAAPLVPPLLAAADTLPLTVAPSPFRTATGVHFTLPRPATVRLAVHDVAGRTVLVRVTPPLAAGPHVLPWDGRTTSGRPAAPGVYFLRVIADGAEGVARVVRLR